MSQSSTVENPYVNRYDSATPEPMEGPSSEAYDYFESSDDFSDFSAEGYGAEDLQRIQEGQSDAPSDEALFAGWDDGYFSGTEYTADDFDGAEALKSLEAKINGSSTVAPEEKAFLLEELKSLQQQYLQGEIDPSDLEYEVEALDTKIGAAKEEAVSQRKMDAQEIRQKLESLLEEGLESSQLDDETAEKLRSEISELQTKLAEPNADLDALQENLKSLEKQINRETNLSTLAEDFKGAGNAVPKKTKYWKATQEFTLMVNQALKTGNWADVTAYLGNHENDGLSTRSKRVKKTGKVFSSAVGLGDHLKNNKDKKNSHRVVQQFVGTLFHKVGGGDEEKLDALLSLIPEHVIQSMISVAEGVTNDAYSGKGLDTPAETAFYGTPMATAQRLREHLEWNEETYLNRKMSATESFEETPEGL